MTDPGGPLPSDDEVRGWVAAGQGRFLLRVGSTLLACVVVSGGLLIGALALRQVRNQNSAGGGSSSTAMASPSSSSEASTDTALTPTPPGPAADTSIPTEPPLVSLPSVANESSTASSSPQSQVVQAPEAPEKVTAIGSVGASSVVVSWVASSAGGPINEFQVIRNDAVLVSGISAKLEDVEVAAVPIETDIYQVKALGPGGEALSLPTNVILVETPSNLPSEIEVSVVGSPSAPPSNVVPSAPSTSVTVPG